MAKKKQRRGRSLNDVFNRKQRRKMKPLIKHGHVMAVIRPEDPDAAVAEAREIQRAQDAGEITPEQAGQRFDEMLTLQEYRFVGIASRDVHPGRGPYLLDADYTRIKDGYMEPGDSFVPYDDVLRVQQAAES